MIGKFPEVLDSSMLADFKACPWKFKLTYIDQWKPRGRNTHLHAGGAFAHGLEAARRAYYEGMMTQYIPAPTEADPTALKTVLVRNDSLIGDSETSQALAIESLLRFYGDHQPPAYGSAANKTALRMAGGLEFYFERYPLNNQTAYPILMPGGKRGIEFSFANPLALNNPDTGQPLMYCGRADGIFQYSGGNYIFDDKTASQLGETWAKQWKLRAQFSGYCWAAQQAGIKVDGVVVRGVSFLKSSYGTVEDISFRSEYMLAKWYEELLDWIDRMLFCYKTGRWQHAFDHACSDFGGCGFQDSCDMEDQRDWLARSHMRKHWDPVTRTETVLEEPT